MPTKFKPSQTVRDRKTGQLSTTNYYMKGMSKDELFEYVNSANGRPRIKQKCRNELVRRGIKIVYVDKE
jgi:hypothetical protein